MQVTVLRDVCFVMMITVMKKLIWPFITAAWFGQGFFGIAHVKGDQRVVPCWCGSEEKRGFG